MSYQGWLMFGNRGPIIGDWPQQIVKAPRPLGAGDRIVIDNGLIREARIDEGGVYLPEGARIHGTHLEVPAWWWVLHFSEVLGSEPLSECCGEGLALTGGASREPCADCPLVEECLIDWGLSPNE